MPPVREASTKPSAATVLPAPVACSNQKRLPALGSSGAAGSWLVVVGRRARPPSPAAPPARRRPRRGPPRPGSPAEASGGVGGRRASRAPFARRGGLGQQRGQRARERVDLVRVEHGAVGELGLVLREQPVQAEQQRPALAPGDGRDLGAGLELRQRGVERAAAGGAGRERVAASSPSSTNGSRVNAAARSMASSGGMAGAASRATGVGSAMTARCDKGVGAANGDSARLRGCGPGIRGLVCRRDRRPRRLREYVPLKQTRRRAPVRSATVWGMKRAVAWIVGVGILTARAGHRPVPGRLGPAGTPPPAKPFDLRRGAAASSRARRPSSPRSTPRPTSCSTAALEAFNARMAALKGTPDRDQQVGVVVRPVPGRVPGLPAGRDGARQAGRLRRHQRQRQHRTRRRSSSPSTPCRTRPTSTPTRRSRRPSRRAKNYPITVFVNPEGEVTIKQGTYRDAAALEADIDRYAAA